MFAAATLYATLTSRFAALVPAVRVALLVAGLFGTPGLLPGNPAPTAQLVQKREYVSHGNAMGPGSHRHDIVRSTGGGAGGGGRFAAREAAAQK